MKKNTISIHFLTFLTFLLAGCNYLFDFRTLSHNGNLFSYEVFDGSFIEAKTEGENCYCSPDFPKGLSRPKMSKDANWLLGFYPARERRNMFIDSFLLANQDNSQTLKCVSNQFSEAIEFYDLENKKILVQAPYEIIVFDMNSCTTDETILSTGKSNKYRGISWDSTNNKLAFGISTDYMHDQVDEIYVYDFEKEQTLLYGNGIAPSWSTNGNYLAFVTKYGVIFHNVIDDKEIFLPIDAIDMARDPFLDWNLDSSELLISLYIKENSKKSVSKVYVYSLESNELKLLVEGGGQATWIPIWLCR